MQAERLTPIAEGMAILILFLFNTIAFVDALIQLDMRRSFMFLLIAIVLEKLALLWKRRGGWTRPGKAERV